MVQRLLPSTIPIQGAAIADSVQNYGVGFRYRDGDRISCIYERISV